MLEAKNWLYWLKEVGKSELLGVKFSVCFPVKGLVLQAEIPNNKPINAIFFIFLILDKLSGKYTEKKFLRKKLL